MVDGGGGGVCGDETETKRSGGVCGDETERERGEMEERRGARKVSEGDLRSERQGASPQ